MKKTRVFKKPSPSPHSAPDVHGGKLFKSGHRVAGTWAGRKEKTLHPSVLLRSQQGTRTAPLHLDPHEQSRAGVTCRGQCRAGQQLKVPLEIRAWQKQSLPAQTMQFSASEHCKGFKCLFFSTNPLGRTCSLLTFCSHTACLKIKVILKSFILGYLTRGRFSLFCPKVQFQQNIFWGSLTLTKLHIPTKDSTLDIFPSTFLSL